MGKKKKYIVAVVVAAVLVISGTLMAVEMINKDKQAVLDATFTEYSTRLIIVGAGTKADISGPSVKV